VASKDGGPAFPVVIPGHLYGDGSSEIPHAESTGLSLRDWFAGKALYVVAAYPAISMSPDALDETIGVPQAAAKWAYEIADAMLAARESK
jgi:hypothetical protein